MEIQLLVEVESEQALATILKVGSDYSLFDYNVLKFEIFEGGTSSQLKSKEVENGK